MNTVAAAQLLTVVVRDVIPAAIELKKTLKEPIEGVTEEDWAVLEAFAKKTPEDYKRGSSGG